MKKQDTRGPVVVVTQYSHEHGPSLYFPATHEKTPNGRLLDALRSAAAVLAIWSEQRYCECSRSVWVKVRGEWVPA